jgi:hypothetical protein
VPQAQALELVDTCSTPCCGCKELDAVWQQLDHLGTEAATVIDVINRLKGSVDQTTSVILGSRLGDSQCRTC